MTIVLDASAIVLYLVDRDLGPTVRERVLAHPHGVHMPHHAAAEVLSALRGLHLGGDLSLDRAAGAVADLRDFRARRWAADLFLSRAWELRDNLTAYDALYVALAEALDATLITHDHKLARGAAAAGECPVEVI